ncbi:MAG: lamin tail domain-containing protein [Bacteroidetes bacterium]|nr:lamin tail domain-containing protein [Bacteroidota bacterium]
MAIRLVTISYLLLCTCLNALSQTASRYDIVIDELFPDPSPSIGLPNAEFIELKNVSNTAYNMQGWKISNQNAIGIIKSNFILQPDSFVVICSSASADLYSVFGSTIGISGFPSLANDDGTISLISPEGITIHAVLYNKSFYQNDIKSDGGWSLEMIDTRNPCSYNNWKASIDNRGGTPATKNSVDAINTDQAAPSLLRTYTIDSITIRAIFDEPMDSVNASVVTNYQLDQNIGSPVSATPVAPLFNEVELKFPVKISANLIYQLTVNNITDCAGNMIGMMNTAKSGVPFVADTGDIVFNEILFNPKTNGYDYVELYNRSNKIIDMKQLLVANMNAAGSVTNKVPLSSQSILFFPGEYYVISENSQWVNQNYIVKSPEHLLELSSLPSLPDDHGNIVLFNYSGTEIDALEYDHNWQFPLIDNEEGVALERLDYNAPTQNKSNWSSAASTSGFGTPTYQNSQFKSGELAKSDVSINPKTFSPDNDGHEDFCFINYNMPAAGYVANITVYDAAGRPVRYLAKNAILGLNGNFRWDGLNDNQQILSVGIYIVFVEVYNPEGDTKRFKRPVVLAKKW